MPETHMKRSLELFRTPNHWESDFADSGFFMLFNLNNFIKFLHL